MTNLDNERTESTDSLAFDERPGQEAFVRLYGQYYDDIFRYCVHRLFERHMAEDVTSEVFLKVVEHLGRFKGQNEPQLRAWLYRIANNAINSHQRKTGRRQRLLKRLDVPVLSVNPTDRGTEAAKLVLLKTIMLTLKPRYQTIITLRFFENLRLTDIAEVLGCSPGTARSSLARAIAQLRKKLKAAGVLDFDGGDCHE